MAYTVRYGADYGGGYNDVGAVDTINPGHYIAGGDVWAFRFTLDGGNSWWGCNQGLHGTYHARAAYVSKRPATSGLGFFGTGTLNQSGGNENGNLYGLDMGSYRPVVIDSTHGFGNAGFGTGAGNTASNTAKRPSGDMIDGVVVGGVEYIFTVTAGGVWRYTNAGANAAAVSGPTQMATAADIAVSNCNFFTTLRVLDRDNIIVLSWDRNAPGSGSFPPPQPCRVFLLQANTGHLDTATGTAQVDVTTLTHPVDHIYDLKRGKDGVLYAACGLDGIYRFSLSGTTPTWTLLYGGNDNVVSSADADSAGKVWAGQAGGNSDYSNGQTMAAGHGVIGSNAAQNSWSYPPATGTIGKKVFKPGDGATATGVTWWIGGKQIALDGNAYDCSIIRVDPFDDQKILLFGRSGTWQSRNGGASWYPAVQGFNGSEVKIVRTQPSVSATRVVSDDNDYVASVTDDVYVTASVAASVPAGNGKTIAGSGSTSYVGDDGQTYVFTQSTGAGASLTRNGTQIPESPAESNKFKGAIVNAQAMAVTKNGSVIIGQYGGGVFVVEPGGPPPPPGPTITSFTPATAAIGATVTVNGSNFTGATSVQANGTPAGSFTVVSSIKITFVVPSGATTGAIRVTTPNGFADSATSLVVAGSPLVPTITSFTPTTAAHGDTVTITGTNLTGATSVKVGTLSASFTVVSGTSITLTVPTSAVTGKITVTTPGGTVVSSGTLTISAGVSAPTITSFTPTTGVVGDTITVTGTNFTNASSVKVNTTSASFTVASSTSITLTIPNAATTGKITVTTPGGTVVSSGTLTVSAGGGGASPFVRVLDSQAPTGTGTTATLTIPTGGVPVGHTVIVGAGSNNVAVTGVADSRGNTYTSDASVLPATATAASLWSAPVTTALLAGDTITVTYSGTVGGRSVVAAEYQYLVSPANDAGVTGSASSVAFTNTSASVSVATATSQANEVKVSFLCVGGSGSSAGTVSAGANITKRAGVEQASGTQRAVALGDKNLTSVQNPVTSSWSWTTASGYSELQTGYKVTPPGGGGTGVAPVIRQDTRISTLQTASTVTFNAWPSATLAGSRIVVLVGITDNGNVGIGVSVSGGGTYQQTAQSPAIRSSGGAPQASLREFHLLNASAGSARPVITFTGLPGAGVNIWAIAFEVTGSHTTVLEDASDTDPQAKATGSAQAATLGPVGPTTRDGVLWLAAYTAGNIDAVRLASGSTFTEYTFANQASPASVAKWSYLIARKAQTLSAAETAAATIAGGFNHNYAGLIVAIPSPDAGGGGGGGGTGVLPDTNDGTGHFSRTGQYFPAITSGAGRTAVQNAQWIAGRCDIVIENVSENASGVISADKYSGLAGAMQSTNPDIILSVYGKGPQIDEGVSFFPNTYYAHQTPWPSGATIPTGFSPNILRAQPYSPDQPNFTDPRGFTAGDFRTYRALDAQHTINTYNTLHGAGTLNSWFHDSSGAAAYSTLIADPLHPTQTYQAAYPDGRTVYLDLVYTIPDTTIATLGTGYIVIVNGLGSGAGYYNNLNRLLSHCHVGYAEVWLKKNYVTFANAWPIETDWQQSIDMLVHANEVLGKGVICAQSIANDTAGSAPTGWVSWTTPQIDQGRRFCFASYMLGKRGAAWFEYVPTAPTGDYTEDDPWYHVNLGAPLDNPPVDATGHGAAIAMKVGGIYQRHYQFGSVYVNPSTATVSFALDQDYYTVAADGSASATLYGAAGATKTLPAHDAVIVYTGTTPPPNTSPPVGTITAPPTAVSTPDVVFKATYTDPDGDNVVTAEARNFTNTTTWTPMTQAGGVWSAALTLTAGANVLQTRATDGNVAPQTSSPIQRTVTYTAVTPSAPVNSTPPVIPSDLTSGAPFMVDPGTWTNNPTQYTYTMRSRPASGGTFAIIQQPTNDPSYTPTGADVGMVLRATVVALNGATSAAVDSNVSNPVQPAALITLQVVEE